MKYRFQSKSILIEHGGKRFSCQLRGSRPPHSHIVLAARLAFPEYRERVPSSDHQGTRPGLAFSGGYDSTAASALLGKGVALYLSKRDRFHRYASRRVIDLRSRGWTAYTVACNVQYLRKPTGFPTDLSCVIPLVLNAAGLGIDSIATGTVLESAYHIGRGGYRDFRRSSYWRYFAPMFESAGLPLNFCVAGLSEVATKQIVDESNLVASSCIRRNGGRCLKCYKCFKVMAIEGKSIPLSREIQTKLRSKKKAKHLNVIDFASSKFKTSFGVKESSPVLPLDRWYGRSEDCIAAKYRDPVISRIVDRVEPMNEPEKKLLEGYRRR